MQESRIRTVKASEARQHFAELVNEVFREGTRVVVEKSGIPAAALVSADDLARLTRLDDERESRRDELRRLLDEMSQPFASIPSGELQQEIDRVTSGLRAERQRASGSNSAG